MRGARFSGQRARKTECTGDSDSAPCTLRRRSVPGALKSAPVGLDQCGAACCAAPNRAPQSHLQRPALTVPIGKHPGMAFMFPIPSSGSNLSSAPTGGLGYTIGGYVGFVYGTPDDGLKGPFVNDTLNIGNYSITAYYSGG